MVMKKQFILLVLLSQLIFCNCSENADCIVEVNIDEIENIAENLQKVIDESNPKYAGVYIFDYQSNSWKNERACNGFKLDKPFMVVCGESYNLKYLFKYKVGNTLKLYFKY